MLKLFLLLTAFAVLSLLPHRVLSGNPQIPASGTPPRMCIAIPDKPEPKKPPELPQLTGESNWGLITQGGAANRAIFINGHDRWHVDHGEIRADGMLSLMWIESLTGRRAPGLYTIHPDGSIVGFWNYEDETSKDADGNYRAFTCPDTLREAKKTPDQ